MLFSTGFFPSFPVLELNMELLCKAKALMDEHCKGFSQTWLLQSRGCHQCLFKITKCCWIFQSPVNYLLGFLWCFIQRTFPIVHNWGSIINTMQSLPKRDIVLFQIWALLFDKLLPSFLFPKLHCPCERGSQETRPGQIWTYSWRERQDFVIWRRSVGWSYSTHFQWHVFIPSPCNDWTRGVFFVPADWNQE